MSQSHSRGKAQASKFPLSYRMALSDISTCPPLDLNIVGGWGQLGDLGILPEGQHSFVADDDASQVQFILVI